jgi:O-6-methylguanine DNA methyltransferase
MVARRARVPVAAREGLGRRHRMPARCGHCSTGASDQMLRRIVPTAERTVTRGGDKKQLTKETRLENALTHWPAAHNGTDFQRRVWDALRRIPVGHTVSYSAVAATIGQPTATRAVGLANGANPIAIAIPCHRVIGANASLAGYGGGLDRKRWLLAHERTGRSQPEALISEV